MSTTIYDGAKFTVGRVTSSCQRCDAFGRMVQFRARKAVTASVTVCFNCLNDITDAATRDVELLST